MRSGDVLISTVRTYLKAIAVVPNASERLVASTGFCILRPGRKVEPRFIGWVAKSEPFVSEVVSRSVGVSYPAIKPSDVGVLRVPIPDRNIQHRIADFLDERTTRIDGLIAKKTRLLELLAEQRQALITRAVTKGLDPSAPMKPSGIDWLGDIPAHWEEANIRRYAQMRTGHTPSRQEPMYWENCSIPWFTLADVWQLRSGIQVYLSTTAESISELGLANSAAELLPAGTVILSRTASVGYTGVMPSPMATSQDFWNYVCSSKLHPEYLLWQLRAMSHVFSMITSGSTHKTIYQGDAAALRVLLPPHDEQERITAYVTHHVSEIDNVAAKVQTSIQRLSEYRAALITAAVTGHMKIERTALRTAVPAIDAARVRVVVGAEIIHRHRGNAWAGRTKLQKLLYLAESHADIHELRGDYSREAAGPMAGSLLDAVEAGMADAGFYQVQKHQSGVFDYPPLSNAGQHVPDLEAALGERVAQLRRVIDLLRDWETKNIEGVATLYAVWNEELMDGHDWTNAEIITAVLTDWHPEKSRRFSRGDLATLLDWMRRQHLTPRGVGPRTRQPGLFA